MNVIDSVRELLVLTAAGIVVYKLDHKELAAWIMASSGCSKDEAKAKIGAVKLGHVDLLQENTNDADS